MKDATADSVFLRLYVSMYFSHGDLLAITTTGTHIMYDNLVESDKKKKRKQSVCQ